MSKNRLKLLTSLAALLLLSLACNFSASTANISDAWLSSDPDGIQKTSTFRPEETFHCTVELANASDDTMVKVSWTAENVEGEAPDTFLKENELTSGSASLHFELSNSQNWPAGNYKADIYLNGELDRSLRFSVQGPAAAQPEPTAPPEQEPTPGESLEPKVTDLYMSQDDPGDTPVSSYGPQDIFYAQVQVDDTPADAVIKSSWYALEVEGITPNSLIDEAEISGGDGHYTFNLTPNEPWPNGTYFVEIYINGVKLESTEFSVSSGASGDAGDDSGGFLVEDAYLTRDEDGNETTTVFAQDDIFYAHVLVSGIEGEITLVAKWYAVNAEGVDPNYLIDEVEISGGDDIYTFNLSNNQLWPSGEYMVEIFVGDENRVILEFEVQ